jgi:hypothetical protein
MLELPLLDEQQEQAYYEAVIKRDLRTFFEVDQAGYHTRQKVIRI